MATVQLKRNTDEVLNNVFFEVPIKKFQPVDAKSVQI